MPAAERPTLRFAPSPTGYLHLGHAYSALLNADLCHALGGRLLLRIEDIDTGRSRPEFTQAIIEDLQWLGIAWEGDVAHQSERFAIYAKASAELEGRGMLYRCAATRRDIAQAQASGRPEDVVQDPDGAPLYAPVCDFDLSLRLCAQRDGPFSQRLDLARATRAITTNGQDRLTYRCFDRSLCTSQKTADPSRWGDAVLVRKETPASYHLASVIDDAEQGVTHIVRGVDIEPSTDLHRLLQVLLGLPEPVYHHHPLLLGDDGNKLSKGNGAKSIREYRAEGATAEDIRELVGLPPACGDG